MTGRQEFLAVEVQKVKRSIYNVMSHSHVYACSDLCVAGCILGSLATSQSEVFFFFGFFLGGGVWPLVSTPMISIKYVCVLNTVMTG